MSAQPPTRPTTEPTTICRANSPAPASSPTRPVPVPVAARRLTISAIPTGSFAPDSPSSIVPVRPAISRLPRTEKTTAGSVGDSAVPTSNDACHEKPKKKCAASAIPVAVSAVPMMPTTVMVPAEARNRRQPMCIPPSKRTKTSATVTIRSLTTFETVPRTGKSVDAADAASRNSAGAGTRIHALRRLDITAAIKAAAATEDHHTERLDVDHELATQQLPKPAMPSSQSRRTNQTPTRLPGTPDPTLSIATRPRYSQTASRPPSSEALSNRGARARSLASVALARRRIDVRRQYILFAHSDPVDQGRAAVDPFEDLRRLALRVRDASAAQIPEQKISLTVPSRPALVNSACNCSTVH